MSATSLDDVYLKNDQSTASEDKDSRPGSFTRGIKERFSARFKFSKFGQKSKSHEGES